MACSDKAATLHLNQITGEKLIKLDLCDGCANMFWRFAPGDAPTPPRADFPAAPGQTFLDSLNRRISMRGTSSGLYTLTLPGIGIWKSYTALELLDEVSFALYADESLIKECVLSKLPAWEAVELAELVCISAQMHSEAGLVPGDGGLWRGGLPCGSLGLDASTGDLLLQYCSLLHHHAALLSEHLIPQLPFACEAVRLARALAIAEQVLAQSGDKTVHPGTVANPSPALQRALDLHAETLLGADEGMIIDNLRISVLRGHAEARIGHKQGTPVTEPKETASTEPKAAA